PGPGDPGPPPEPLPPVRVRAAADDARLHLLARLPQVVPGVTAATAEPFVATEFRYHGRVDLVTTAGPVRVLVAVSDARTPDPLPCAACTRLPDGSLLAVTPLTEIGGGGPRVPGQPRYDRWVAHHRPDGSTVLVENEAVRPGELPPLTVEQLTTLATDPALLLLR
ncbi:MAG TPA: hypothetical protein VGD67_08530, partial [Pseudonocardiaceae bacterium]